MAGSRFDRMTSTIFVAVLAHGIVILGITFAPFLPDEPNDVPTLNVTLLVETDELNARAADAEFLASRNEAGGGGDDADRPTRALASDQPMNQRGEALGVDTRAAEALAADSPVDRLVSRSPSDERVTAVPETTDTPAPVPMSAAALLQQTSPDTLAAEIDLETASASSEDADLLSPSTRESLVAAYIVGWRQRVERVGTANFPREFLDRGAASARPVVEVTIDAGGNLEKAELVRTSGDSAVDQAAIEILRLAGPFEPLPDAILAEANVLRFAYEWYFATGDQRVQRVR